MKTLSLRLTDMEAEALERIAYLAGTSKNKALEQLIANAYENIDIGATDAGEIVYISSMGYLAQNEMAMLQENPQRSQLLKVLKYLNYAIEHHAGDDLYELSLAELENYKQNILLDLKDM